MSDYVESPIELRTSLPPDQIRKVVNKSLKTFGGFRYRSDKNANDFRCEVTSGGHSGGTVIVQIRSGGAERRVQMVVTEAVFSSRLGVKHTMGIGKANGSIDHIIKKIRKDDPDASVQTA